MSELKGTPERPAGEVPSSLSRTYIGVLVLEAAIVVLLWVIGRIFQ